ncbi:DNA repair protein complementing XP-C cells-like [Pomacea canaliculata]|uniref:DNA repair protein complementing XP-C cells-like n=1 Tax=Pomacea canaliculata TaxID=400727 RepID=UPI000D7254E7|nr:DNA repair protein complementing XP-C cells-like [Pomacea canaliculata]
MRRMQVKDNTLKENELKEGSEEEFEKVPSFSVPEIQKERKHKKANRSILSSSSSNSPDVSSKSAIAGHDSWLEVYMAKEKRWICVDCVRCTLDKPYDISSTASQPLLYVLAFDNKGHVKDITARYAPQWLSQTRKKRVNAEWWQETLEPYASTSKHLDDREDQEIAAVLMQKPLPTSIGEYKNHPLYALPRHLLKFEAIYPETSVPVGYIRQEPVYARECVHVLHSRDNWLKEGRTIRFGETAYKRVKSRKRWRKRIDNSEELDLELFGRWQTEIYVPPPAVDGKITKNEYGNVELFQPSMLPGGTVHLRVPALNRVAKKLGIDIAPAMVGWDHHCGYSHPVLDGWIVCKEHKKILLAAWKEDQIIQQQREAERREKRVLANWTTLTRGLLIKERLKKKFNLMDKNVELEKIKQASTKGGKVATDAQHAWPAKQQQKTEETNG